MFNLQRIISQPDLIRVSDFLFFFDVKIITLFFEISFKILEFNGTFKSLSIIIIGMCFSLLLFNLTVNLGLSFIIVLDVVNIA